jgi:hypothetical protein
MLGKEYSEYEIIIGIISIISIYYVSQYINITLFQMLMIITVCITIYIISNNKKNEIERLQTNNTLTETDNKKLLEFMDSISYFNLYNPQVYTSLKSKIRNYINLVNFSNTQSKNNYKLYSQKIVNQNLATQKKDILETFLSFEHTLDDRIISTYKLNELNFELDKLLGRL